MCAGAHVHLSRSHTNKQLVAHQSCLELRGIHLVWVSLENILSNDKETKLVLKPIFITVIPQYSSAS